MCYIGGIDMLNKKPKLGVDFDEVIFDFMGGFLEFSAKVLGEPREKKDVTSFFLEDIWGISPEEMTSRIDSYYHSEFHHKSLPVEGALEALSKISQYYDIHIITASPLDILPSIERWLEKNNVSFVAGIHCTRKNMQEKNPRKKIDIARELDISYMIDDASHIAEQFVASGIDFFLLTQPWNKDFNMDHVVRVENWGEIEKKILGE